MSNSTLADYYQGMKMQSYDGTNIFSQIRNLNGAGPGYQEVIDGQVLSQQELYMQQQKRSINQQFAPNIKDQKQWTSK